MTLVEVTLALTILALSLCGILAALIQSRRLTEGSVSQNSALTIVQGYMEQIKNMELKDVVNAPADPAAGGVASLANSFWIPTRFKEPPTGVAPGSSGDDGMDGLYTSTGTPPDPSLLPAPGTTPSTNPAVGGGSIRDNLKDFSDNSGQRGTATTWFACWPGRILDPDSNYVKAQTYTTYPGDLHLNMWVWINDLSNTSAYATQVYGITIIYTYQYRDGQKVRYIMGTVRSIRSTVPTF